MFSMSDEAERADRLVGPVYPRSLLYLVSGLLETDQDGKSAVVPIVGLQRWCDGVRATTPELQAVKSYIEEPGHVVWSPAGGSLGFSSAATTHSGFDDDDEVLASVKHLIQN
jgi:hypothetical protein